jgi:hypothetical protein
MMMRLGMVQKGRVLENMEILRQSLGKKRERSLKYL